MSRLDAEERCGACNSTAERVLRPPAGVRVVRGWNEKANEYQRDPYSQAKAQTENAYNAARDQGQDVARPTEAGVQVAAKAIDDQKRRPAGPGVEQRAIERIRRDK